MKCKKSPATHLRYFFSTEFMAIQSRVYYKNIEATQGAMVGFKLVGPPTVDDIWEILETSFEKGKKFFEADDEEKERELNLMAGNAKPADGTTGSTTAPDTNQVGLTTDVAQATTATATTTEAAATTTEDTATATTDKANAKAKEAPTAEELDIYTKRGKMYWFLRSCVMPTSTESEQGIAENFWDHVTPSDIGFCLAVLDVHRNKWVEEFEKREADHAAGGRASTPQPKKARVAGTAAKDFHDKTRDETSRVWTMVEGKMKWTTVTEKKNKKNKPRKVYAEAVFRKNTKDKGEKTNLYDLNDRPILKRTLVKRKKNFNEWFQQLYMERESKKRRRNESAKSTTKKQKQKTVGDIDEDVEFDPFAGNQYMMQARRDGIVVPMAV